MQIDAINSHIRKRGIQKSMNWQAISFDWNQVRAFLATAEEGSLSAAARALRMTQPTLSRQVSALESDLGVTLFERGHRSMSLTPTGLELLEHVRAMGDAATRVSLAASGRAQSVEGRVSITATHMFAFFHLPPILARIRQEAPGLQIEVVASNDLRDLGRREADIAIRHARPEHGDLIAKKVGETKARFFAAKHYLDKAGRPTSRDELAELDFIGFEYPERMVPVFDEMGIPVTAEHFKFYSASGLVILSMVEEGLGVAIFTDDIVEKRPNIELVMPELPAIDVPIWLVTHRELQTSQKIRVVYDLIAECLTAR